MATFGTNAARAQVASMLGSSRQILSLLGLFLAFFLLFFYLTFPAQGLAERLFYELRLRTGGVWSLQAQGASVWRLSGMELRQVQLQRHDPTAAAPPPPLALDALRVRLQLLPLLLGKQWLTVHLQQGEGLIKGGLAVHAAAIDAKFTYDRVSLAQPVAEMALKVPTAGTVQGRGSLHWENAPAKVQGEFELAGQELTLGPGTLPLAGLMPPGFAAGNDGLELPQIPLGTAAVHLKIVDGMLQLEQLSLRGGALQLSGRGSLQLKVPATLSAIDMCLKLRAEPEFLQRNPRLASIVQIGGAALHHDADGSLQLAVVGPLQQPRSRGGACF